MAWPADEPPSIAVIRPDGSGEHRAADLGRCRRGLSWMAALGARPDTNRLVYGDRRPRPNGQFGDAIAVINVDTGVETIVSDVAA